MMNIKENLKCIIYDRTQSAHRFIFKEKYSLGNTKLSIVIHLLNRTKPRINNFFFPKRMVKFKVINICHKSTSWSFLQISNIFKQFPNPYLLMSVKYLIMFLCHINICSHLFVIYSNNNKNVLLNLIYNLRVIYKQQFFFFREKFKQYIRIIIIPLIFTPYSTEML